MDIVSLPIEIRFEIAKLWTALDLQNLALSCPAGSEVLADRLFLSQWLLRTYGNQRSLDRALDAGRMDVAQLLLRTPGMPVQPQAHLIRAALGGHQAICATMIDLGTPLMKRRDCPPLYAAAQGGHCGLVVWIHSLLSSGESPMVAQASMPWPLVCALSRAVSSGHVQTCRTLLWLGAQPRRMSCGPLWQAAKIGSVPLCELMLEHGADVHDSGDGALRVAAANGHLAVMEILLAAGAEVSAADNGALVEASAAGRVVACEVLLRLGANPTVREFESLHRAYDAGHQDAALIVVLALSSEAWLSEVLALARTSEEPRQVLTLLTMMLEASLFDSPQSIAGRPAIYAAVDKALGVLQARPEMLISICTERGTAMYPLLLIIAGCGSALLLQHMAPIVGMLPCWEDALEAMEDKVIVSRAIAALGARDSVYASGAFPADFSTKVLLPFVLRLICRDQAWGSNQEAASRAVLSLSRARGMAAALAAAGVFPLLTHLMSHRFSSYIADRALRTVRNLPVAPSYVIRLPFLVKLLDPGSGLEDAGWQEQAVRMIKGLATPCRSRCHEEVVAAGAIPPLLRLSSPSEPPGALQDCAVTTLVALARTVEVRTQLLAHMKHHEGIGLHPRLQSMLNSIKKDHVTSPACLVHR